MIKIGPVVFEKLCTKLVETIINRETVVFEAEDLN